MLQQLLKQATAPQHDALEQLMFVNQIMCGSLTVNQYKKLLLTNYLSHAIFEHYLLSGLSPALQAALNAPGRSKLEALQKDMAEMQLELPDINSADLTPVAANDAAILGALYVLEGATLGGHVIVKRLMVNPQLKPMQLGYHYYQVYGPALVDCWKQFVEVLNTYIPEADYPEAVQAAQDMFGNIQTLCRQTEPVA